MKEIGGYFELEIWDGGIGYHPDALALNTGRNALEYTLRVRAYKKVHLPAYHCDAMLEPLAKLGIEAVFYAIDLNFEFNDIDVKPGEGIIYINYFGLKDAYIKELAAKYPTLIIDNAQAFFSQPITGIDTAYSARKYFGVPDGGYVYIDKHLPEELPVQQNSYEHYRHLVGRIDSTASNHYSDYSAAEKSLCNAALMQMSHSTRSILSHVNYEQVMARRRENYVFLYQELSSINRLQLPEEGVFLCYPLLHSTELKQRLIHNKVYTPTYWPNVQAAPGTVEHDLKHNLICLPIDHRYTTGDMQEIIARMA